MRIALTVLMAVVPGGLPATVAKPPFTLTLAAVKSVITAGNEVDVTVTMTNTSDRPLDCTYYWRDNVDQNYGYTVLYEGKPDRKASPRFDHAYSTWPCMIDPGKTSGSRGTISNLYDFSRPGRYTIQADRYPSPDEMLEPDDSGIPITHHSGVKEPGKAELIRSNTITITVLSGRPK